MAKILLIEPDTILAGVYKQALTRAGHSVEAAIGAQVAINSSDKTTPDLVIMEIQLASHNGIEFLYEFRSYPEWQSVPVIVLSRVPPNEFGKTSALWGELAVVRYYYKPNTSLRELVDGVESLIVANV